MFVSSLRFSILLHICLARHLFLKGNLNKFTHQSLITGCRWYAGQTLQNCAKSYELPHVMSLESVLVKADNRNNLGVWSYKEMGSPDLCSSLIKAYLKFKHLKLK